MMNSDFDPYTVLMDLKNRVNWLEANQQQIVQGLNNTQKTLETIMNSVRQLQIMAMNLDAEIRKQKEQ